MKHRHILLLVLIAALSVAAPLQAAAPAVRAWLDRDTMQLGETVTLNVESSGDASGQPDFSALSQDFSLLGTQSSQQVSIVNGASTTKTVWAVGLEPKHAGRIAIPAIAVGAAQTQPITLNVLAAPAGAQGKPGDDVFLEVTAEPTTPYVQQQVRYSVKLYFSFGLTDGNLGEPQADGVVVQRLGQDKSYLANVGDRRYHVMERHYALTPEKSGTLDLPALVFRGNALDAADPTGFFSRPRTVSARSDAVQLQVKPKPSTWPSAEPWLPAESVLLKDETELPNEIHVGDPVTRTIRLQAQGLGFEQLPELNLAAPEGAEIYPDKPDTRTRDDGTWLYGERVRKFAFVPTRPGAFVIPGVSVKWWDTAHDRIETAELPAHSVNVLPATGAANAIPNAAAPAGTGEPSGTSMPASAPAIANATASPRASSLRIWQALAALGFLLWLATLALWWRSRPQQVVVAQNAPPPAGVSAHRAAFLRAAALGELARRLDDAAQRDALASLQKARYAGGSTQGVGTQLDRAFKGGIAWTRAAAAQRSDSVLPGLYHD